MPGCAKDSDLKLVAVDIGDELPAYVQSDFPALQSAVQHTSQESPRLQRAKASRNERPGGREDSREALTFSTQCHEQHGIAAVSRTV